MKDSVAVVSKLHMCHCWYYSYEKVFPVRLLIIVSFIAEFSSSSLKILSFCAENCF